MRRQFLLKSFIAGMMMSLIMPLYTFAYDQYESMNVGETKTFYFPSEVTNRASAMYAYNCSSDHINHVEVVSYTNTSVTVKALAYTQSQVNIRFDYWWYENNYGRHDTHMVHIDLNGGGGGGNTGSDYNPYNYDIDYGSWGAINVEEGSTTTVYCQYNIPNQSKVKSILWSDYQQISYEITSQSSSSCTIKGRIASSGGKLWCLMKYGNTSYKAYYTVNVKESTKQTLSLTANPDGGKVDKGKIVYLTASNTSADIYYTLNGTTPTSSSNKYSSSGIAINEACTLKAVAKKTGYNDSPIMTWVYTVNETSLVTSITLSKTSLSLQIGQSEILTATVKPDDATDKSVTWSSDNESVATVSNDGKVTAVATGSATIICTANDGSGVKATCDVAVKAKGIEINTTNFPDVNFRNYLLNQNYGQDGVLTDSEINSVKSIDLDNKGINSLEGIEFFTSLKSLYCENNQLTFLDVSKNTALKILWFNNNRLTSFDVSKNTALENISCCDNPLISIDVTNNTALEYLYCWGNQLTSLDVSKNKALVRLVCWGNQLTSLDISNNAELDYLYCGKNQLTSLDISKNKALTVLRFHDNQIKASAMDNLISGLPQNTTSEMFLFEVIDPMSENEGNICTKAQVAAVKAKGWFPCYWNKEAQEYEEYEGSEIVKPESIKFPSEATVQAGQTITLTPTVIPANAETTLTWSSDDESVATVNQNGMVTGVKKGRTFINVETDNGKTAYCKLTVTAPEPIKIELSKNATVTVGGTITLTPTITPKDAETTLTWESDDVSVVRVDANGVLTGVAEGLAIVTVSTANGLTSNACKVMVEPDSSGISTVMMDEMTGSPIYTPSGQRLTAPRKGINIVGGKKVIVK